MATSIPLSQRTHFPPLAVDINHEAANQLVSGLTGMLTDEYGLHLFLGAELEETIGMLNAIIRTLRGDRMRGPVVAYDSLLMGPDKIFDYGQAISAYRFADGAFRQFQLPPYEQTSGQKTRKMFENLVTQKRQEVRERLTECVEGIDQGLYSATELIDAGLNELVLMAETIAHRIQLADEIEGWRNLQQTLVAIGDETMGVAAQEAIRMAMQGQQYDLFLAVNTLLIDPAEAVTEPMANPVYTPYPHEADLLFRTVPKDRHLILQAFYTQDEVYYAEVQERHPEMSVGDINRTACELIRAKMRDRNAVIETVDHLAPVVHRSRLFESNLEIVNQAIFDEEMEPALFDAFRRSIIYGSNLPDTLANQRFLELANQLIDGFGLDIERLDYFTELPIQAHQYLQEIICAVARRGDALDFANGQQENVKNYLANHLERMAEEVENWSVAALGQWEKAWGQTEIRALPEYQNALDVIMDRLAVVPDDAQQEIWSEILRASEAFHIHRIYGYGSSLDEENVVPDHLVDLITQQGITVDATLHDALRQHLVTRNYEISDLMVRDLRASIEEVYGRVLDVLNRVDPSYAASLPPLGLWNAHVEGGGPEFAREIVTSPLPAEVVRVVTTAARGLLSGEIGESIGFTAPDGQQYAIDTSDFQPMGVLYPELFFNGYSGAWTVRTGQHLHYSVRMRGEDGYFPEHDGIFSKLGPSGEQPTELANYTHLAMLKLLPDFRAVLGNSPDAYERWLSGLASPDHIRALDMPSDMKGVHQIARAAGDAIRILDDRGELRAAAMNADSRLLYSFVAIAHQHATDHYVLDAIADRLGVQITSQNFHDVVQRAFSQPQHKEALEQDPVINHLFNYACPAVQEQWTARVSGLLESGKLQQGELKRRLTEIRQDKEMLLEGRERPLVLAFETVDDVRAGRPAGPPIVDDWAMQMIARGQPDRVQATWNAQMIEALRSYVPAELLGNLTQDLSAGPAVSH